MRENVSPSARHERHRTDTKQGEDKAVERQRKKAGRRRQSVLYHRCRCGAIIPIGTDLCERCAGQRNNEISRHMQYNKSRRDKKAAEFYVSPEWRKLREKVLTDFDHVDLYAYYVRHRIEPAEMVHHIVEISEDWSRRLDTENLFPMSNKSHGIVSNLYKDPETKKQTQKLLIGILEEAKKGRAV